MQVLKMFNFSAPQVAFGAKNPNQEAISRQDQRAYVAALDALLEAPFSRGKTAKAVASVSPEKLTMQNFLRLFITMPITVKEGHVRVQAVEPFISNNDADLYIKATKGAKSVREAKARFAKTISGQNLKFPNSNVFRFMNERLKLQVFQSCLQH